MRTADDCEQKKKKNMNERLRPDRRKEKQNKQTETNKQTNKTKQNKNNTKTGQNELPVVENWQGLLEEIPPHSWVNIEFTVAFFFLCFELMITNN